MKEHFSFQYVALNSAFTDSVGMNSIFILVKTEFDFYHFYFQDPENNEVKEYSSTRPTTPITLDHLFPDHEAGCNRRLFCNVDSSKESPL